LCVVLCIPLVFSRKFQQADLNTIVQQSIQLPEEQRLDFILQELNKKYGTTTRPNFHLFNGGGAFGIIGLVYASLNEYLIIFGSVLPNGGHSGRYFLNFSDFVYRGKITIASPKELEGREVKEGQATYMAWGDAHHYTLDKNTWMVEHAHGLTISGLPIMIASIFTTTDIVAIGYLVFDYVKHVVKSLIETIF